MGYRMIPLGLAGVVVAASLWVQDIRSTEAVPAVGARVRVVAPGLVNEWQIGMFNRLRVEPPCYRILLFEAGPTRRIRATLSVRDITRIQVSTIYHGRTRVAPPEGSEEANVTESWSDVSMIALRAAEERCPARGDVPPEKK